ncbi:hypothetical protein POV27_03315 [Aureisphaera galaxeae]|uniref:hypothetical protein n=1 Tax=Aureisphaera galaxeae TaxID=1538023 RepID=UPI0023501875|nr:hypothetical protein [Aureisphaera galaxeae]MDC8003063.1 hypothetical protein [Aureisphaera galaxeae]
MHKAWFIIGGIIFILVIWGRILDWSWKRQLKEVQDNRKPLMKYEYISLLKEKGYDPKHAELIHDELKSWLMLDNFNMHPEDDVFRLYKIDESDIDILIDDACKKLKIRKIEQKDCDLLNSKFETTSAEYLVALLQLASQEKLK